MIRGFLVADHSGSITPYADTLRRVFDALKHELSDPICLTTFRTSSSYGMEGWSGTEGRPLGEGGGDGTKAIFEYVDRMWQDRPSFIIYLTDDSPCFDNGLHELVAAHKMLIVDVTEFKKKWAGAFDSAVSRIYDALLHDGDCPDAEDCNCEFECECEDDCEFYEYHNLFQKQPFFLGWSKYRMLGTPKSVWAKGFAEAMNPDRIAYFDELYKATNPALLTMAQMFKHPVDKDLDEINKEIDQGKDKTLQARAMLACEVNVKIRKVLGGNSLTPAQHERLRATKYRMYTELLNLTHQQSIGATYGKDGDKMAAYMERIRRCRHLTDPIKRNSTAIEIYRDLNRDNVFPGRTELMAEVGQEFFNITPEVQEGHHMSTQITTTVSLKVHSRHQATLADLKALITEVERVGGTDESYVNLENTYRNGCFDAVVVTARQEPEVDPRVEAAASIEDTAKRVAALLDLSHCHPSLRNQVEAALVGKPATPRKSTQAKAKQ